MRIAVTYDNGKVFQHFGKTKQFKIVDESKGVILGTSMLEAGEAGHSALAGLLYNNCVDVVICGGIGGCAIKALTDIRIKIVASQTGDVDEVVKKFLNKELDYTHVSNCSHHHDGSGCGDCK